MASYTHQWFTAVGEEECVSLRPKHLPDRVFIKPLFFFHNSRPLYIGGYWPQSWANYPITIEDYSANYILLISIDWIPIPSYPVVFSHLSHLCNPPSAAHFTTGLWYAYSRSADEQTGSSCLHVIYSRPCLPASDVQPSLYPRTLWYCTLPMMYYQPLLPTSDVKPTLYPRSVHPGTVTTRNVLQATVPNTGCTTGPAVSMYTHPTSCLAV